MVCHCENGVWIIAHGVAIPFGDSRLRHARDMASKVLSTMVGLMETRTGFLQLVSAVVGLSVGVGVMTATVLLGVAALLQ